MTGLAVAIAFKTGLFNIGAPGQYLMGAMVALVIALGIPSDVVPPFLIWIIAFVGAILAGALWGAIPGIFKAFLNVNEVITCIMPRFGDRREGSPLSDSLRDRPGPALQSDKGCGTRTGIPQAVQRKNTGRISQGKTGLKTVPPRCATE